MAIAGLNIVYNEVSYPTNGPFMGLVTSENQGDGTASISVQFDQPLTYDTSETNGFYVCCGVPYETCDTEDGLWQLVSNIVIYCDCQGYCFYKYLRSKKHVPSQQFIGTKRLYFSQVDSDVTLGDFDTISIASVSDDCTGLAYLWAETPVQGMEAAPIYADDEFGLPGAPWKIQLVL